MFLDSVQPFLDWIQHHPTWAGIAVFLISLSESLAIVGLVVPGVVMMTAIGAMMGSGILPFWETLTWAILGAIAGDGISYWLGYHYHERLRLFWPFKQFPGLLARGEKFFKQHGGKSIIFGRFVGPVRPMIPVIAGMMDMTPKRFLVFNILSAIAWAPLYSLPGILIGASLGTLPAEAAQRVGLLILLVLLILWLLYEFMLTIGKSTTKVIQRFLEHLLVKSKNSSSFSWIHQLLKTNLGSEEGQLGLLFLFLISAIFSLVVFLDALNETGFTYWNEPLFQILRALYTDRLVDIFTFLTVLGEPILLLSATAVSGLWLLLKGRRLACICWVGTIFSAYACTFLMKQTVQMPRPEGLVYLLKDYAFPSGHVVMSTVVYGFAAVLLNQRLEPNHRWIPWAIAIPIITIVSISRIYLGVHWFTDILEGLTLGITFIALGTFIYRRFANRPFPLKSILFPGIIVILIGMTIYGTLFYSKKRAEFVREWQTNTITKAEWWKNESETKGLYRVGAFKHLTTPFEIQWLSSLDNIKKILEKMGWKQISKITFNTALMTLADAPDPLNFPVAPKFHRDRLPVLIFVKKIDLKHRYVLQIWNSDFITPEKTPLWVGSLKIEEAKQIVPLTTFFIENNSDDEQNYLEAFQDSLKKIAHIKTLLVEYHNHKKHQILLLDSTQ